MKRNLRRILNADAPKFVKSAEEVAAAFENSNTMEKYGYNLRHTEVFYIATVINSSNSFSLFGSHEVIKMIEQYIPENRNYLLDGTFDVAPAGYYQLLVIYVEYQNDVRVVAIHI